MFSSFQAPLVGSRSAAFQQGLFKNTYTGYFTGPTWFATATKTATTKVIGALSIPNNTTTSYEFIGWFKAPYSEAFNFVLSSDDQSYLWIGSNAQSGFTTGNKLVSAAASGGSPRTGTTGVLTKGVLYAFRLQVGNSAGPGDLSLSVDSASLVSTSDLTGSGLVFFNPNTQGI